MELQRWSFYRWSFRGEADSFRWGWGMFPCHQVLYQSPEDNPHSDKVELTVYTNATLSEFGFSLRCDLIKKHRVYCVFKLNHHRHRHKLIESNVKWDNSILLSEIFPAISCVPIDLVQKSSWP